VGVEAVSGGGGGFDAHAAANEAASQIPRLFMIFSLLRTPTRRVRNTRRAWRRPIRTRFQQQMGQARAWQAGPRFVPKMPELERKMAVGAAASSEANSDNDACAASQ
jgi:hypothetical protein